MEQWHGTAEGRGHGEKSDLEGFGVLMRELDGFGEGDRPMQHGDPGNECILLSFRL